MRKIIPGVFALMAAAPVAAADWCSIDSSAFTFETTFEGEALPGEFSAFDVRYTEGQALRVLIDLTAADMGDPDMNEVLADPAWFAIETFPEARFTSESIRESGTGQFVATGTLDLKGIEQTVAVPFVWLQQDNSASMRGTLFLDRTDFDVGSGEWSTDESIGLQVRLAFDVQFKRCD